MKLKELWEKSKKPLEDRVVLALTSPDPDWRDWGKKVSESIKNIEDSLNRVKNPRSPFCPHNGCVKGVTWNVNFCFVCECGQPLSFSNKYCYNCGKCFCCGRMIKKGSLQNGHVANGKIYRR